MDAKATCADHGRPPIEITRTQIARAFDADALARAVALHGTGAVEDLHLELAGFYCDVGAVVRDGAKRRVALSLSPYDADPFLALRCSCRAERCHHAAAAALAVLERTRDPFADAPALSAWIAALAPAPAPGASIARPRQLVYQLAPLGDTGLCVTPHLARLRRSGEIANTSACTFEQARAACAIVQPAHGDLRDTLHLIAALPVQGATRVLRGDLAALTLARLLGGGRAFWSEDPTRPLTQGEPIQVPIAWRATSEGLCPSIHLPDGMRFFDIGETVYLDVRSNRIATLSIANLTPADSSLLLAAPPLPARHAHHVSRLLLERFPGMRSPCGADTLVRVDVAATPVLRFLVDQQPQPHGQPATLRQAHLAFSYDDGFECPDDPAGDDDYCVVDDQRIVIYTRDIHGELAARELYDRALGDLYGWRAIAAGSPGAIARPVAQAWHDLQVGPIAELASSGWRVVIDPAFGIEVADASDAPVEMHMEPRDGERWFELGVTLQVDSERVELVPLVSALLDELGGLDALARAIDEHVSLVVRTDQVPGREWLAIPSTLLRGLITTLVEIFDRASVHGDLLRLNRAQLLHLAEVDTLISSERALTWRCESRHLADATRLGEAAQIAPIPAPPGFVGTLAEHQEFGLGWAVFIDSFLRVGLLMDGQGAGKTATLLAFLLLPQNAERGPSLVLGPKNAIGVWQGEAAAFVPSLPFMRYEGSAAKRETLRAQFPATGIVAMTYELLVNDLEALCATRWNYLIADESHDRVTNHRTRAWDALARLPTRGRILVTGTPVKNSLSDLWAQFELLLPGYLGTRTQFRRLFERPISELADADRAGLLARRIQPFSLRRTDESYSWDVVPGEHHDVLIPLSPEQAQLYESIRASIYDKILDYVERHGIRKSQGYILNALLRLRQVCLDPRLLPYSQAKHFKESTKLNVAIAGIAAEVGIGRSVLVFSNFTQALKLLERDLRRYNREHKGAGPRLTALSLTGETPDRDRVIADFKAGKHPIMLLSLGASSTSITVTKANVGFFLDGWWNSAREEQAFRRMQRKGQTQTVYSYDLVMQGTIEERMRVLKEKKRAVSRMVIDGLPTAGSSGFTIEDVQDLCASLTLE